MAEYAEGVPCWADVMLPDLEAGKRFYGALFGWTFPAPDPPVVPGAGTAAAAAAAAGAVGAGRAAVTAPAPGPGSAALDSYAPAVDRAGRRVAALTAKPDGRLPTAWNVYLATADARAAAGRVREAGGQVVREPLPVAPYGTVLTAADPAGAVFGVWEGDGHAGFEAAGEPGTYRWAEVYTRDAGRADAFYEQAFGMAGKAVGDPDVLFDYRIFAPAGSEPGQDTAVLGRFLMGDGFPDELPAHFLVYFGAVDVDEATATVRRLGGRVTLGPQESPFGRWATVTDDQGAVFALIETPAAAEPDGTAREARAEARPDPAGAAAAEAGEPDTGGPAAGAGTATDTPAPGGERPA
jgi:predicted enzyme related to lactoylglutathione lyase